MAFHPADPISLAAFSVFAAVMFVIIVSAVRRTGYRSKKFVVCFVGYLFLFCGVVASGLPARFAIPFIPLLFLSIIVGAIAFAFSRYGQTVAQDFSLVALIGFQSFRLPLELILHHWADIGTVPATMTWTGQNWDILAGVLSLLGIPFVNKSKGVAWAIQVIGFLLLMNVIRVVILSSPFPFAWQLENPIQLVAYLPYALIGPLFVGAALAGHLVTFRKLLRLQSV
jgi:hypothetical protein